MAGQRRAPSLLIGWLDPSSVLPLVDKTHRASYTAGKQLAARIFLDVLALADDLGAAELSIGLVNLPTRQRPLFTTPGSARQHGWRPEGAAEATAIELSSALPALLRFFNRAPHRLRIAEICADEGLHGNGLALILSKCLIDALGTSALDPEPCSVLLLVPDVLLSLLEHGGVHPEVIQRLYTQADELTRSVLPARVTMLATHDEHGNPELASGPREPAQRPRGRAARTGRTAPAADEAEGLARQALEHVLTGRWALGVR